MGNVLIRLSFIAILPLFISCDRTRSTQSVKDRSSITVAEVRPTTDKETIVEQQDLKIKLYIENSGSMFGYVKGRTAFKDMLQNLLVDLKYDYDEEHIEIYFINSKVHASPIKAELVDFADKLSPNAINIGETGSSDLNNIFNQIVAETDEVSISILVSDFIYSIKGKETHELLGQQEALTKNVFLTAAKEGKRLTTNIYQFISKFDGFYYDLGNHPSKIAVNRPYYIAVLGEQSNMTLFAEKIGTKFNNYAGYSNEYLLTEEDFEVKDYTVLTSTLNIGVIKPVKGTTVSGQVREIELNERGRGGMAHQFAVALDLNALKITEDYISSIVNYEVISNEFSLLKIGRIVGSDILFDGGESKSISASDLPHIKFGPTHVFVFQSLGKKPKDLMFRLKRNIPQWVSNSSLIDDRDLNTNESKQSKTFGLDYLMRGVSSAYLQVTEKGNYFKITIPIQKPKSSSFAGKAIGFIFLATLIALISRVILKRKTRK